MTSQEALRRAHRALRKAEKDSDHFDCGGLSSPEIMRWIERALVAEFTKPEDFNEQI